MAFGKEKKRKKRVKKFFWFRLGLFVVGWQAIDLRGDFVVYFVATELEDKTKDGEGGGFFPLARERKIFDLFAGCVFLQRKLSRKLISKKKNPHTHTHTHAQPERERATCVIV